MTDFSGWSVHGSSVRGTSHESSDVPCQDAHCYFVGDDRLIVAVADGAGSAPRADEGAQVAVDAALKAASELLDHGLPEEVDELENALVGVLCDAQAALAYHATQRCKAPAELFATTLTIVVADVNYIGVAQVGDGCVVANLDGRYRDLASTSETEYVNETTFLTSRQWGDGVAVEIIETLWVDGLAVLTDGLLSLARRSSDGKAHEPFFEPLFRFARSSDASSGELEQFLRSDRVCCGSADDLTLVLATRSAQ